MHNRPKKKNASSKFFGVSFHKSYKKWSAYISYNGKNELLGYFVNELDAAKAYNIAAKKYYGEFARLNFSKDSDIVD